MTAAGVLAPGTVIGGKYCVESSIGGGGMGWVYVARDQRLDHLVALKVLAAQSTLDLKQTARFVREARVAAHVESKHVAKAHDFGICETLGLPFIAFELLYGADLERVLAREGPLPVERAVDYIMQALAGVAAAHMEGIAHRDLKPANLFRVEVAGRAPLIKVLDFGIAKALKGREIGRAPSTATGEVFGTPLYMAPEQLRHSKRVDQRADVWSIGVILYECLTGHSPFAGVSMGDLIASIMKAEVVPWERWRADLPPPLRATVLRCLQRRRENRFPSVRELARALAPFGSASAHEVLAEIEALFDQNTDIRPSDAELAETVAEGDAQLTSTLRMDANARPSRAKSSALLVAAAFGIATLLVVAGAVGFLLARR